MSKKKPLTTAYVCVECQNFSKKSIKGKVSASNFEWSFIWKFGTGELIIKPPLGRALIKDSLERFLVKDDYKLEPGGSYMFTIRAKF
ncbi:DUF3146 family protein [Prochlorococcus sp. MIT 1223]|uniref:DUF3146 family protein n=1 Tax=Prochlorococcus sp. MIT 1223 TaxID=3096217 RepID=UPI002A752933|nr:DUF3146 family protein [Prochlorococcus sp. MIT 1223]